MKSRSLLPVLAFATAFGFSLPVLAATVEIWGASTPHKRLLEPGAKACKEATGIEMKFLTSNSGRGLASLIEGKCTVAAVAEDLKSALNSAKEAAKEQGKELKVPDDLVFHELFKDGIVPIVHKENSVTSLTWEQLKDIFTGKVKNWKDVGGPDLPIRVVTAAAGDATANHVQKTVLGGAEFTSDASIIKNSKEAPQEVSKFKGGIGAVSEGVWKLSPAQTKEVKSKPITRAVGLVTVGKPTGDVAKVVEFYQSKEGQKYLQ
ncbi:MAG: substrate-binding domain-containing protein [Deltaproteobacteria bacterium]|nr:substrate-binding domain-containing protein [Deltaproteobacteria bacterium]